MDPISLTAAAVDVAPAGGAAIWEAVVATVAGVGVTLALLALGWAHRSGRTSILRRLSATAERYSGLPYWAALPTVIVTGSLLVAAVGMYWDISIHVSDGRDPGPFANSSHFLILGGLFGVFSAGMIGLILPEARHGRAFVRIGDGWWAPLGSIGLLVAAGFALIGFPLDDMWHRVFGQDVTLWGPTHLMLIGGAALAFIGQATLLGEAAPHEVEPAVGGLAARIAPLARQARYGLLSGGFLIGLSTFQAEFDFGVPQFRMIFEPIMLAFAAGVALSAARIYGGRGTAVFAALFFLVIRGGLALLVGSLLNRPTPYLPLYLGAAILVEVTALVIAPRVRPYSFAALSGAAIGSIGFFAEYGWSQFAMPVPWPHTLIGDALVLSTIVGIASGLIGAFIAIAWLAPVGGIARSGAASVPRIAPALGGLLVIVVVVTYGLQTTPVEGVRAEVRLSEATPAPNRMVDATVRITPPSAAEDADWLNATAWQGGGFVINRLDRIGPGHYKTTEPLPVDGTWKTVIRLHREDSLVAIPIYLPRDTAIPADEVPAPAHFTRQFVADSTILQREQVEDVPGYLKTLAYAIVGLIVASVIALLGWSLRRLASSGSDAGPPTPSRQNSRPSAPLSAVPAPSGARPLRSSPG